MKFQWSHPMVYKNITLYRSFKKSMLKWDLDYVYEVKLDLKWIWFKNFWFKLVWKAASNLPQKIDSKKIRGSEKSYLI